MNTNKSEKKSDKSGYDVKRDRCVAPALVMHLDAATGNEVRGPGEGVMSFGIVARSMQAEDGTPGQTRIGIHGVFVAKESTRERQERWIVGANGKCSLGLPTAGSVCLGSAIGRLSPALSAVLFAKVAAYAVKVSAALAAKPKAA